MRELRVAVIDDDYWKRTAMAVELDAHPQIAVVHAIDQDEAITWPLERWAGVDVAIVDVFDENAPSEVGTDMYSGIAALDRLKDLPVRTLAITPHCQHPLIQLRLHQARADWLYHRWEVNDIDLLIAALLEPQPDHRPVPPTLEELELHGAPWGRPNESIRVYEASPIGGLIKPDIGLKSLGIPRRAITRIQHGIHRTGFIGPDSTRLPRWPEVRDYLLIALGRRSVPPTEVDRDDGRTYHDGR